MCWHESLNATSFLLAEILHRSLRLILLCVNILVLKLDIQDYPLFPLAGNVSRHHFAGRTMPREWGAVSTNPFFLYNDLPDSSARREM